MIDDKKLELRYRRGFVHAISYITGFLEGVDSLEEARDTLGVYLEKVQRWRESLILSSSIGVHYLGIPKITDEEAEVE